jgi:uncharacterized protein YciI
MLFVFHGLDRPDSAELRQKLHDDHATFQHARANPVGGPLLDDDALPCGTMFVFEARDVAEAAAIVADDPYVRAGLFDRTSLRAFRAVDWPQSSM